MLLFLLCAAFAEITLGDALAFIVILPNSNVDRSSTPPNITGIEFWTYTGLFESVHVAISSTSVFSVLSIAVTPLASPNIDHVYYRIRGPNAAQWEYNAKDGYPWPAFGTVMSNGTESVRSWLSTPFAPLPGAYSIEATPFDGADNGEILTINWSLSYFQVPSLAPTPSPTTTASSTMTTAVFSPLASSSSSSSSLTIPMLVVGLVLAIIIVAVICLALCRRVNYDERRRQHRRGSSRVRSRRTSAPASRRQSSVQESEQYGRPHLQPQQPQQQPPRDMYTTAPTGPSPLQSSPSFYVRPSSVPVGGSYEQMPMQGDDRGSYENLPTSDRYEMSPAFFSNYTPLKQVK